MLLKILPTVTRHGSISEEHMMWLHKVGHGERCSESKVCCDNVGQRLKVALDISNLIKCLIACVQFALTSLMVLKFYLHPIIPFF